MRFLAFWGHFGALRVPPGGQNQARIEEEGLSFDFPRGARGGHPRGGQGGDIFKKSKKCKPKLLYKMMIPLSEKVN